VKEDFLHFIWKHQLLNVSKLVTSEGENISLISPGEHNENTGPDFFNAQLIIDNQRWAGNVEIHINSSDWYVHGHEKDTNYDNVILHVVWEYDVEIYTKENLPIPTLELKNNIDKGILENYFTLFSSNKKWINCENEIGTVDRFIVDNWLERLFVERLEQKSEVIQKMLDFSKNDWESVLIQMLSKNFGLKVNGASFLDLINSIDFSVIRKEKQSLESIEALFFGQAGLLNESIQDTYGQRLLKEYNYLSKKYKLSPNLGTRIQFFRLRPNNFPTIRLAQLAALLNKHQNLFSKIMATKKLSDFYKLFDISISEYWKTHYSFTSVSKKSNKKLSKSFVDLLVLNTIIPLKFMYFKQRNSLNEEDLFETLRAINPEKNAIIGKFNDLKTPCNNALESQALLQLKNEYCIKNKCMFCAIGNNLLRYSS